VLTRWRDLDSVKRFAGDEFGRAGIADDESPLLQTTAIAYYETLI
jgi:hypothetical protein